MDGSFVGTIGGEKTPLRDPLKLFILYGEELARLKEKLAGNSMTPQKRREREARVKCLEERLIPGVRNELQAIADAAKTFRI
ncbi:MAG: hypothetical protein HYT19_00920 [Candidatus Nealsonbacteria bacterium]|nr:hypothetical protein [Candidatus Nealsonbacteria bacterium]